MSGLKLRKALIAAKIETTEGVDAAPGTNDCLIVANLKPSPMKVKTESRDIVRPFLGNSEQLVTAVNSALGMDAELAGSGTAGVAPRIGRLLRMCGFAELVLAAALTGTAAAGAASSITLAAGASASDDAYKNLEIRIVSGPAAGDVRLITGYNGTTKVATVATPFSATPTTSTNYSLDPQVSYAPISDGMESGTLVYNMDGTESRLRSARGDWSLKMASGGRPMFSMNFQGLFTAINDAAPLVPTYANQATPLPVNFQNTPFFAVHGYAAKLRELSIACGNVVTYRNLVNQEGIELPDRKMSGNVIMEAVKVATHDFWEPARVAGTGTLEMTHGTVAGNIVRILSNRMQLIPPDGYTDEDGIAMVNWGAAFIPTTLGNDELVIIFK